MIKIRLDDLLREKNKSRYWLSKQTGISYNAIKHLCIDDITVIQLNTITQVCLALNCTPNDIFDISKLQESK